MMHTMRDELKIDLEPELKIDCTKVSGEWKKSIRVAFRARKASPVALL